jgi:hypothetical protein
MIGVQKMMDPVDSTSKIVFDPCPSCHTHVMTPKVAASEIRLRTTAFAASTTERNARVRAMKVRTDRMIRSSGTLA